MNSLLTPGPWHVTPDNVVRDINGAPIAVVLSRHPQVHAELIAQIPTELCYVDGSKDALIRALREKLSLYESED